MNTPLDVGDHPTHIPGLPVADQDTTSVTLIAGIVIDGRQCNVTETFPGRYWNLDDEYRDHARRNLIHRLINGIIDAGQIDKLITVTEISRRPETTP
jgi:hypothetical protein